jgi:hypothetical protein
MTERPSCAHLADTLAEVATGAASGPDRALVLNHLAGCADCRRELDELTRVADDILLVAPEHEPPAGFESAVLARIAAEPRATAEARATTEPVGEQLPARRRRFLTPLAQAAAAVLLALGAAGLVWQTTEADRDLAAAYRDTLDVADGRYFSAVDLLRPDRASAGTVFFYEGNPSWLFTVVRDAPVDGSYDIVLTSAGRDVLVTACEVRDARCGAGATVDVPIYRIDEIRLIAPDGTTLTATLPSPSSE